MIVQACCSRIEQACGCVTWMELAGGTWVKRTWTCNFHQEAPQC